ncbi:unnamed protein product [Triticum turgidum subsp. durum]|uniref:Glycosyltransferase n=1 Tax=Triticum turgidum subsp. durum TaxID=4567 RepID=A0A9R0V692_TRITD|nr:unnamed protein product [Triticum turgidum subsp. durum]
MTNEQLLEFGWGLADSGYAFIWNIRPDLVRGETAVMPPEFLASVHGRAMLTTWCPQAEVLRHEAVGAFLTHSGIRMELHAREHLRRRADLCWPFAGEQQTNCRYKHTEWGIGVEIGAEVKRAEVAAMIREAMVGEKGRVMKRRGAEWKEKALRASLPGGAAEANLDEVIRNVLLAKYNAPAKNQSFN